MRGQMGVEVEPYEMLEMVRAIDTLDAAKVAEGVAYVKTNWTFKKAWRPNCPAWKSSPTPALLKNLPRMSAASM